MIYSGLDWSGSPGPAHGPYLVFAIAHAEGADLDLLAIELAKVRAGLRIDSTHVFHHVEASAKTRTAFFQAFPQMPVSVRVHMLDKTSWGSVYVSGATGTDCICDGIVTLLTRCPEEIVKDQMLYIDLNRKEGRIVVHYRTTIRQAMRRAKQPAFKDMKPRPDDHIDGALIQIADMVAGEVWEHSGMAGPYLPSLRAQIRIV